jgi:hypothetical protein
LFCPGLLKNCHQIPPCIGLKKPRKRNSFFLKFIFYSVEDKIFHAIVYGWLFLISRGFEGFSPPLKGASTSSRLTHRYTFHKRVKHTLDQRDSYFKALEVAFYSILNNFPYSVYTLSLRLFCSVM